MRAPTPSAAAEIAVPDIRELLLRIDEFGERLRAALMRTAEHKRERLAAISQREVFIRPAQIFDDHKDSLSNLNNRAASAVNEIIFLLQNKLASLSGVADAMSPLSVLKRGYSLCEIGNGEIVASADSAKIGDNISVILSDGTITATVNEINKRGITK